MKNSGCHTKENHELFFISSCSKLNEGFAWAVGQARAYYHGEAEGFPVGPWYEAALPGRDAFCMRDMSHQAPAAWLLGMADANRNMFRRFAGSIAASRDWCAYWEIDQKGRAAEVDYRNDGDFWYNLPANFDLMVAIYRIFLWSGDLSYIQDPIFTQFFVHSLQEYITTWDKDGDGIPEYYPTYGPRGLGSYFEGKLSGELYFSSELVSSLFAGITAAQHRSSLNSGIQQDRKQDIIQKLEAQKQDIRHIYRSHCFDKKHLRYYFCKTHRGHLVHHRSPYPLFFGLFGFLEPDEIAAAVEFDILSHLGPGVEEFSYHSYLLFHYGYPAVAMILLQKMIAPNLYRREYPELSFSVVETYISGLLGLAPLIGSRALVVCNHIEDISFTAEAGNIPFRTWTLGLKQAFQSCSFLIQGSFPEPLQLKIAFRGKFSAIHVANDKSKRIHQAYLEKRKSGCYTFADVSIAEQGHWDFRPEI